MVAPEEGEGRRTDPMSMAPTPRTPDVGEPAQEDAATSSELVPVASPPRGRERVPATVTREPPRSGMYARSTSIRSNPDKLDDGIAYVAKDVLPTLGQSDGCIGLSMLTNRDDGRCIVTTSWRDDASMRATSEEAR